MMAQFFKKLYDLVYKRDAVRTSVNREQALRNNWSAIRQLVSNEGINMDAFSEIESYMVDWLMKNGSKVPVYLSLSESFYFELCNELKSLRRSDDDPGFQAVTALSLVNGGRIEVGIGEKQTNRIQVVYRR